MPSPEQLWYDARACAAALKMSLRTFRKYLAAGVFPKGLRGSRLWEPADLEWMRQALRYDQRLTMLQKINEDDDEGSAEK